MGCGFLIPPAEAPPAQPPDRPPGATSGHSSAPGLGRATSTAWNSVSTGQAGRTTGFRRGHSMRMLGRPHEPGGLWGGRWAPGRRRRGRWAPHSTPDAVGLPGVQAALDCCLLASFSPPRLKLVQDGPSYTCCPHARTSPAVWAARAEGGLWAHEGLSSPTTPSRRAPRGASTSL